MNIQISSIAIGILIILVGFFEIYSHSSRNFYFGIPFIFYGIGTVLIGTQRKSAVRVGIIIGLITVILHIAGLLYEKVAL